MTSKSARKPSGGVFDVSKLAARQKELLEQSAKPDFWDRPDAAQAVLKELDRIKEQLVGYEGLRSRLEEARLFLTMAEEEGTDDSEAARETEAALDAAREELERQELQIMLGGEFDRLGAIVSIHPGAGGTEAQDWAEMLLRLYLRWAERRGYKTDLADLQPGDGAGIKSATFTVEGDYAYGYLKAEAGIHRLVRISPYDANARRHTSFASVFVFPAIDHRYGWSSVPASMAVAGDILIAVGFLAVFFVFKENSYASSIIEVGAEQKVVATGPYAIVRHPMYSGALVMLIGVPLALGSWWGLLLVIPITVVLVWRLMEEEKFLTKNLLGYPEYQQRVRFRLLPFVW